jgi:tetratricopeptide (TPR) repeat protein
VVAISAAQTLRRSPMVQAWYEQAVAAFGRAAELNPAWSLPPSNRAMARLALGRMARARREDPLPHWRAGVADLDGVIRRYPDTAGPYGNRALLRLEMAEWERGNGRNPLPLLSASAGDARAAIRLEPGALSHYVAGGQIEIRLAFADTAAGGTGDRAFERAFACGRAIRRLNPRHWYGPMLMGQVAAGQGRLEEALEHLLEAQRLAPGNRDAANAVAQIKRALGR